MYACSGELRVFETAAVSWSIFKDAYVSILLCEVMISDDKIQLGLSYQSCECIDEIGCSWQLDLLCK